MSRRRPRARRARPYRTSSRGRAPWRRWFPALAVLALLFLAPVIAHAAGAAADSATLRWTAVGDDSLSGRASAYELRVAGTPITESTWASAVAVEGLPTPSPAGAEEAFVVRGLASGATYYFALRVRDESGNWSALSNVARWDGSFDASPPAAPGGLVAEARGAGVHLAWSPSPAPDLAGYNVYRAGAAAGPWSRINAALVTAAEYQDDAIPAGTGIPWYEVTAVDRTGNESARSSGVVSPAAAVPLAWAIGPAWPNPSRASEGVRIALDLAGAAARVDVCDAAGRLVRRIEPPGAGHLEIEWDGRNQAGRAVAPGAYRAWLVAGDLRRSVRLLRLP